MSIVTTACFLLLLIGSISGQFTHSAQWELARRGRSKRVSCTVDVSVALSSTIIHWYRGKPAEAMQRILYFKEGASTATNEPDFQKGYTGGKKDRTFSVTITNVQDEDTGTYYCALWSGNDTVTDCPPTAVQYPFQNSAPYRNVPGPSQAI